MSKGLHNLPALFSTAAHSSYKKSGLRWCFIALLALSTPAFADLYQQAQDKIEAGEPKAAVIYLKNLLQKSPEHQQGRLLLGQLLFENGQWGGAEKELKKAVELGLDPKDVVIKITEAQLHQLKWDAALETLNAQWPTDFESGRRTLMLGDIHLGMKDVTAAESYYYQALQLNNDARATLGLALVAATKGNPMEALAVIEPITTDATVGDRANMLKAEWLLDISKADEALALIERLKKDNPNAPMLKIYYANALILKGEFGKAKEQISDLPEPYPQLTRYKLVEGYIALGLKDYNGAYLAAESLLQNNPNDFRALLIAGTALHFSKENQKAEPYLQRFVKQAPGHLNGRLLLASTLQGMKQPAQAIEVLQPLLELNEPPARALAVAGYAYLSMGDWELSEEYLARALELDPNLEDLRNPLAWSQVMRGKNDAALESLETDSSNNQLYHDTIKITALLQQKNTTKAFEFLQQRFNEYPDEANYPMLEGMIHLRLKEYDQARESYRKALKINDEHIPAYLALARIDIVQENWKDAQKQLQNVLDIEQGNLPALLAMAVVESNLKGEAAMLTWLQRAQQYNPDALAPVRAIVSHYLKLQQFDKARTEAHGYFLSNQDNATAMALYTETLRAVGDLEQATQYSTRLTQKEPQNVRYLLLASEIHAQQGQIKEALEYTNKALEVNDELSSVLTAHAALLMRAGEPQKAKAIADKLIEREYTPASARLMGMVLVQMNQPREALKYLETAAQSMTDTALVAVLADTQVRLHMMDAADALLTDYLKDHPDDPPVLLRLGNLRLAQSNPQDAIIQYERLRVLQPENPIAWNNLAWLYMEAKDPRSEKYAREALRLAPEAATILDTVGWVLLQNGKYQEALKILTSAAEQLPDNREVQYHYAKALADNGKKSEAIKILKPMSQSQGPMQTEARALLQQIQ